MRVKRIIIIICLLDFISSTTCDLNKYNIRNTIKRLKNKYDILYGKPREGVERWNTETARRLEYPRGDAQKLADIAHIWWSYYECIYRLTMKLTSTRRLPSNILMVYEGGVARLSCNLCVAPDEFTALKWSYAETTKNLSFHPMVENGRFVQEDDGNITIYHAERADGGVYRCQIGRSFGGLVILEVVDSEENYTVVSFVYHNVKPPTSPGVQQHSPRAISKELMLFTSWSQWSECSACSRVGRRRRHGICYVRMMDMKTGNYSLLSETNQSELSTNARELFEAFPDGIPCRSPHLPTVIRNIPAVKERRSEIMIAMCKVTCASAVFSGVTQDAGIQPPLPARNIEFAISGQPTVMRCPGTTLRDIPVSWRVGTKYVIPRELDKSSGGRVHLNARDHLVFTAVQYADTNLYSCWQAGNLAGTVKLVVWSGNSHWSHHTALVAVAVVAGGVLRGAGRVWRNKQRRVGVL